MSEALSERRCYHHPDREATSQCDRCGDYLCDDCARERGGRLLCGKCVASLARAALGRTGRVAAVLNVVALVVLCLLPAFAYEEVPNSFWRGCGVGVLLAGEAAALGALVFALRGFWPQGPGARTLRGSLALTACGMLVALPAIFAGVPTVYDIRESGQAAGGALGVWVCWLAMLFLLMSTTAWVKAVRERVGPRWAVTLAFLVPLLGFCFIFLRLAGGA